MGSISTIVVLLVAIIPRKNGRRLVVVDIFFVMKVQIDITVLVLVVFVSLR